MIICSIYKSPRKDEMYLYVDKKEALSRVPEALLELFGQPVHLMDMPLKADKKLARAEAPKVIEGIEQQGYYLQMPPPKEEYLLDLFKDRPVTGVR